MDITGSNPAFVAEQVRQQTGQSAGRAASKTLNANFDTFLTLLTTQLRNQDPLNPLKSNEFTQQLVQYASVEQAIATNLNLDGLIALNAANAGSHAVNYIGKHVTVADNTSDLVDGEASWGYALSREAEFVQVSVINAQGTTVFTRQVDGKTGKQTFIWDGKGTNGTQYPEGVYALSITARDANAQAVPTTISTSGKVSGIDFTGTSPILRLGERTIPLANVITVK